MKIRMQRPAAAVLAMIMFVLIFQVPAKASASDNEAIWIGNTNVVVKGQYAEIGLLVTTDYYYASVGLDVRNSSGTLLETREFSANGYCYSDLMYLDWYAAYPEGTYTLTWYINFKDGSTWKKTANLGSCSIKVISSSTYGWISHDGYWYYRKPNGSLAEGLQRIDGYNYFFGKNFYDAGQMLTDVIVYDDDTDRMFYVGVNGRGTSLWYSEEDGNWFYFGPDGYEYNGWVQSGSNWYFIEKGHMWRDTWHLDEKGYTYLSDSGAMVTGWKQIYGYWHLFGADGYEKYGWQKDAGKWYYMDTNGVMLSGWKQIGGSWYYLGTDGAMRTGWQKVNGAWYLLGSDGVMKTGWQKDGGVWYYFGSDGAMRTGWQKINGSWYYLDSSMATGWNQIGGTWYYFGSSGVMVTGWKQIGSTWYYFKASGAMAANETINIGGVNYRFGSDGAWIH